MSNVHVLNLAAYESPVIEEKVSKEYVTYGSDNSYYTFLIDRYKNSTTNNAIINNVCRLVYGKGLGALDANRKPNQYASFISMLPKNDARKLVTDLKMLGQCAIQVHYSKDRKRILKTLHLPVQLLAPEKCNEEGEITGYYYSDNWGELRKYPVVRFDAFGFGSKEIEIYFVKPYAVGMKYFSYVDYQGALKYALLEEEVADYLVNEVQNSFSSTRILNFNNGVPSEEQQEIISKKVNKKLTGAQGQKIIIAFNDNKESAATIEDIPLIGAADLYTQLSTECQSKILIAHNVTSPLLFGIVTNTGFSSNADELKNSSILFDNMVIKPLQMILIEAFTNILAFNQIALKLYFKTLTPFNAENESTGEDDRDSRIINGINSLSPLVANKVLESMTANEIRALIGLKAERGGSDLAPDVASEFQLSKAKSDLQEIIDRAELPTDEWIVVDERDVDLESENSLDLEIEKAVTKITRKTTLARLIELVSGGNPKPDLKSSQDALVKERFFKVRYQYTGNAKSERDFCKLMMANRTRLFRKEDIDEMSSKVVNPGLGEFGGNTYDIFKFKGGARCNHSWKRVTMMLDLNATEKGFKQVGTQQASIRGYKITNPYQVSVQPNNLPLKGFSPNNKNLPSDVR